MICPISSHISFACPQFYHHRRTWSELIPHDLSMPWSTVITSYSINPVLHYPTVDCLLLPASVSSLGRPCGTQLCTVTQLQVNKWIESQLPSGLPRNIPPLHCPPARTSPIWLDHGLQVHLYTRSIMASIASPNRLDHILQVFLQSCAITASNVAWSSPPSASPNLLYHGLRVHTSVY